MADQVPYMVIHTLCGEPIFYYFGNIEDAKTLRDFDNITTLDGESIVPDDIKACKNCGVKINLSQIKVAEHETQNFNTFEVKKDEGEDQIIDPKIAEQQNEKKSIGPNDFWVTPNDPDRVRRDKPKSG